MRITIFDHEFVEFIPATLEPGRVYISVEYATASHLCACGCGQRVVTPFSPTDWKLTYDGETVTLWPSIGNWSFDCQSHYFVRRGRVDWAPQWSRRQIDRGRLADRAREGDFDGGTPEADAAQVAARGWFAQLLGVAKRPWHRLRSRR